MEEELDGCFDTGLYVLSLSKVDGVKFNGWSSRSMFIVLSLIPTCPEL